MIISALHCLPPPTIHCSHDLGQQLYKASNGGRVDEVERLLARGAPVNWRDSDGWTALHRACWNNHPDVVKIFTQQDGIDVNVQTNAKNTPLHGACWQGHLKCVQLLMATGQFDLGKSVCVSCNTLRPYYLQFIAELKRTYRISVSIVILILDTTVFVNLGKLLTTLSILLK